MKETCILEPLDIDELVKKNSSFDPKSMSDEDFLKYEDRKQRIKKKCKEDLAKIKEYCC